MPRRPQPVELAKLSLGAMERLGSLGSSSSETMLLAQLLEEQDGLLDAALEHAGAASLNTLRALALQCRLACNAGTMVKLQRSGASAITTTDQKVQNGIHVLISPEQPAKFIYKYTNTPLDMQ